jgi:hypothetical protein
VSGVIWAWGCAIVFGKSYPDNCNVAFLHMVRVNTMLFVTVTEKSVITKNIQVRVKVKRW